MFPPAMLLAPAPTLSAMERVDRKVGVREKAEEGRGEGAGGEIANNLSNLTSRPHPDIYSMSAPLRAERGEEFNPILIIYFLFV
jgi:hypothetical protein